MISFIPEGRLGNVLYETAAAIAYGLRHGIEFSMPAKNRSGKSEFWSPVYFPHLINTQYDPSLEEVIVPESGYRFQELPFDESWRDKNITLKGYFQSPKYSDWCFQAILKKFGFPWAGTLNGVVACHIRRGDYLIHTDKHPAVSDDWYRSQMSKFPGYKFAFFSDDMDYCRTKFGSHPDTVEAIIRDLLDDRPEVFDLVTMSMCEHIIGSASTFAAWAYLLNRNPNKHGIFPKLWLVPGWAGTSEETWKDVLPSVERA